MPACCALVVAAGRGSRMGGETPKQYRHLGGRLMLARTLARLAAHPRIDRVVCVINPDDRHLFDQAAEGLEKVTEPVNGGKSRQDSVRLGLEALAGDPPDRVLIHDGARPFVPDDTIDGVLAALDEAGAALPVLAVADTLKRGTDGESTSGGTVDRSGLFRAQTPQGFHYGVVLDLHRRYAGGAYTDDAALAETDGVPVRLTAGSEENIKVTTAEDMDRAHRRLAGESRTGHGLDVHRFGPGSFVRLCGVDIPHDQGLEGHSDADPGLHALTDALLGAVAAGDIGERFPASDDQWRDADSTLFLHAAAEAVRLAGGRITNVDLTLLCERPRVGSYRDRMRQTVAETLGIERHRVSIKATTTERLGFPGRGEGIAAEAVATVVLY